MPDTTERIAELRRELESNPASRQFYQLGELLRRDGRAAEATAVLRGGLGHHPRYVAAWVSLGRACLDRSLPRDAAKALHEALELDAHNPVAWRLLGEARLAEGDRFGALDAMQHALQLAPGDDVLRAAVDALASETWPPADAASEPVAAAVPPPAVPEPPPPAAVPSQRAALSPPAEPHQAPAPPAPPSDPFADLAPPPVAGSLAGGEGLDDPFGAPALVSPAAEGADVFALPAPSGDFADEPFGLPPAPAAVQAAFLPDFGTPPASLAPPPPVAAAPEPGPSGPDLAPPPAIIAASTDEPVPLPAADFASTSAFAAAPLELAPPPALVAVPATGAPAAAPGPTPVDELGPPTAAATVAPPLAAAAAASAPPVPLPEPVLPEAPEMPAAPAAASVAGAPGVAASDERERRTAAARPTLTLARLHLQQQDFQAAITILERVVVDDPDNQEARDLLDLVHDMMAPLPGELPSLSVRERKIAALQGWLASLTLGHERMATR